MADQIEFNAQTFVFETPLYELQDLSPDHGRNFVSLFNESAAKIDGYCPTCGKNSVFHSQDRYKGHRSNLTSLSGIEIARLTCQRDQNHEITIVTQSWIDIDSGNLKRLLVEKIGQTPSHADIANGGLTEFQNAIEQIDRSEFIRANGLAAHGVNIGAFVYLRRLFERLVWRAKSRKSDAPNDSDFKKLRMVEKIAALSGALPDFMIRNKKIYSVLSKGIHELSENDCGRYYELMRRSILLMLEQEKEIKERAAKENELDKLIKQIDLGHE